MPSFLAVADSDIKVSQALVPSSVRVPKLTTYPVTVEKSLSNSLSNRVCSSVVVCC
jgi:hypothetical protein